MHETRGFTLVRNDVPISFFGAGRIVAEPVSMDVIRGGGLRTESTVEIIAKKIRARMINNPAYKERDAYDATRKDLTVDSDNRVLEPRYSPLMESTDTLIHWLRLALAGELAQAEHLDQLAAMCVAD